MGSPRVRAQQTPLPWVALLLAALLAVATLQAEGSSRPLAQTAREKLTQASRLYDEHPYLEPGSRLRLLRSPEQLDSIREAHERDRIARGDPEVLPGILRRQQEELDTLTQQADEAIASLPARRFGVDPDQWRPMTLLTYAAMHGGIWHLVGNLLLLLLLGIYLEPVLGVLRSSLVALAGTVAAGLGYAFAAPGAGHVLIGSSGLAAGLLATFAFELRSSRSENFYVLTLIGGLLWLALPPWLGAGWSFQHPGLDLMGPAPAPQRVYWSCAGGAAGALAMHVLLALFAGRRTESVAVAHVAKTSTGSLGLDQALQARAAGRDEAAFQQLTALLAREPEQLDAALLLSDVCRSLGRHEKADAAMLRAIRLEAKRGESGAAVRHWLDLTHREIPHGADAALLIRIATLLRHHDHPRAASQALRAALDRASGSNTAPVAARVARAAQELDPQIAHDAAWRALGSTELSLEERQNLEDLLAVVMPKLPGAEVLMSRAWERAGRTPAPIDIGATSTRILDVVLAAPAAIDAEGVHITTRGGSKKRVLFERIEAVSAAAVQGLSDKPVLVVDLVLNWKDTREPRLRVIRMRGDRFDPRRVVPGDSPIESLRRMLTLLLERAEATPLPDRDSVLGNPFASFEELALYERTVLMAESPLSANDA